MFHQHIPLNADHSGLVKFESRSHGPYEIVVQKIKKYVVSRGARSDFKTLYSKWVIRFTGHKSVLSIPIRTFACTRTMPKSFGHISRFRSQG
jgi:hypothetical protein